jgi:NADH dehydrogenase [ubiquinone] 1 alpha subcomplex assembly factor 1
VAGQRVASGLPGKDMQYSKATFHWTITEASLQYDTGFATLPVNADSKIMLTIKGDGKKYQFRAKDNTGKYYSYITYFSTTGHWQNISISLRDMYPSFRGRTLDLPNFSANSIEEIVLLIGNKKAEPFKLLIDKIELQ